MGVSGESVESQGSVQMLILAPEPTIQPSPLNNTSLPARIPRQPCDADCGALVWRNEVEWQYFPSRV